MCITKPGQGRLTQTGAPTEKHGSDYTQKTQQACTGLPAGRADKKNEQKKSIHAA